MPTIREKNDKKTIVGDPPEDTTVPQTPIEFTTEPTPPRTIVQRLVAAQQEIGNVAKNATNPHFKNKFVDVTQLLSAVLPALHRNGLFLSQRVDMVADKPVLITQIFAEDGSSLPASRYPIISKDDSDPQKFGAGVTYARRYALMAYLGIGTEDDDGNTAARPKPLLGPEHTALRDNLRAAGYTKETVALAIADRFNGRVKSLSGIPVADAIAWNNELIQETDDDKKDVPF